MFDHIVVSQEELDSMKTPLWWKLIGIFLIFASITPFFMIPFFVSPALVLPLYAVIVIVIWKVGSFLFHFEVGMRRKKFLDSWRGRRRIRMR